MRLSFRLALLTAAPLLAVLAGSLPVSAHPMGNFSINHYTGFSVGPTLARVLYTVDLAEIPTFQELNDLGVSHVGGLPSARRATYLAAKAAGLAGGLSLSLNGRPLALSLVGTDLLFPPGAGGLPTERLYLVLQATLPRGGGTLEYHDNNFPDRAGWKEIVAASSGAALSASTAAATSLSAALTVYPASLTSSPPQDVAATFTVAATPGQVNSAVREALTMPPLALIHQAEAPLLRSGGAWSALAQRIASKSVPAAQPVSWAAGRTDALTTLMTQRTLSPALLALSLLIAAGLGGLHAFSPGHGKTVVAAYIVGSRATARHAVLLGLTVTVTHTIGVFALGLVTLWLSHYIVPDRLYPWLGALSGLFITLIGVTLAMRRLAALRRPTLASAHDTLGHADHQHDHDHDHDHDHQHDHDHGPGADDRRLPDGSVIHTPAAPAQAARRASEEGQYAAL